jgi:hypothetical protein
MVDGFDEISPQYKDSNLVTWYPHPFNTVEKMNHVVPAPGVSYYSVDKMQQSERNEFMSRYETGKTSKIFDKLRVLELYCQADMIVLREACRTMRRNVLHIGNVEVFLASMTITSGCYKSFRKESSSKRTGEE